MEAEFRAMQSLPRKGLWAKKWSQLERAGNGILPQGLQKECSPAGTLILDPWDPFHTSGLQNCKIIHLHCSKPLTVWYLVKATIGKEYNNHNLGRCLSPIHLVCRYTCTKYNPLGSTLTNTPSYSVSLSLHIYLEIHVNLTLQCNGSFQEGWGERAHNCNWITIKN